MSCASCAVSATSGTVPAAGTAGGVRASHPTRRANRVTRRLRRRRPTARANRLPRLPTSLLLSGKGTRSRGSLFVARFPFVGFQIRLPVATGDGTGLGCRHLVGPRTGLVRVRQRGRMQEPAMVRQEWRQLVSTVTFDHVTKKYGEVTAVHDFNLEIGDGEFMVLVGPSGCGKTTNLRMIAGLEEISSGSLRIGDRVVNDVPPKDRDIAMVFQSYALYPHMTVRDNMAFGLKLRKVPKADIEKRVADAAGILSLEKYLDRKPKELSGGQRQRVAL